METEMYRVQERVYGIRNNRRVLIAPAGGMIPMSEARELGLLSEAPAVKKQAKKRSRAKGK